MAWTSSSSLAGTQARDGRTDYRTRSPADGALHRVVREHLLTFLRGLDASGHALPGFVERDLREFITCGAYGRGFARFRCGDCCFEHLIPFSSKAAFCPTCAGRRMSERAAHLVDHVLGGLPVRQWVLTLPHRLRYLMAFNHELCRVRVVGTRVFDVRASARSRGSV